jgi:hypothetical protein
MQRPLALARWSSPTGHQPPVGVAMEISRDRPFASIRRSNGCDSRRRHQCGEAVEQLQRRQQQRAVPAQTGLGDLVEQTLGIQFV